MTPTRPRLLPGALLVAALVLAVALPSAASAAQAHAFKEDFGAAGTGAGQLELISPTFEQVGGEPTLKGPGSGVAVSDEDGDVYVADTANHRISEFDPSAGASEKFIRAWGWGVEDGAAEAQACTTLSGCQAGTSGSAPGEFEAPTFVAVDNSAAGAGDVYVADTTADLVSKFTATGQSIASWGVNGQLDGSTSPNGPFAEIGGIAVDGTGDLWVYADGRVFEFGSGGASLRDWSSRAAISHGAGLGIDGTGDVYLDGSFEAIERYAPDGTPLGLVSAEPSHGGTLYTGLAVDPSHGDLYAGSGTSIDDFGPGCEAPAGSVCSPTQNFGSDHLTAGAGLAVDSGAGPAGGSVYAALTADDAIAVFRVAVESTIGPAGAVTATSATLTGKVNPEGSELSRCRFEYGAGEGFAQSAPCVESLTTIGARTTPVEVEAPVVGLAGGSAYHYRLRATNATGDVRSETGKFQTLPIPTIEEVSATEVTATSATLNAKINPHGLATGYHFEYGPCANASTCGTSPFSEVVPIPDEEIGSGSADVSVHQQIAGLSPGVTYHFRTAATSTNGTATSPESTFVFLAGPVGGPCPDEALRTGLSADLPDCRAYELVTPADKNGATVSASAVFNVQEVGVSSNGTRLTLPVIQCFAESVSCTANRFIQGSPFAFERGNTGWTSIPLAPAAGLFPGISRRGISADAGAALIAAPTTLGGVENFYLSRPGGELAEVGPISDEGAVQSNLTNQISMSPDLSHLLFGSTTGPIWSFDHGYRGGEGPGIVNAPGLYEYVGTGNSKPTLVGVGGSNGGQGSTDLISRCGTTAPNFNSRGFISTDGKTIYFAAAKCPTGTGANTGVEVPARELYARIDGESADAATVLISQSQCGAGPQADEVECRTAPAADANFQGASEDGSIAYFTSTQKLTDDASEDPVATDTATGVGCTLTVGPNGCNLYLYDSHQPAGRQLTAVSRGDSSGLGPQVQGALAISNDGTHIYFIARGVLAGANAEGHEPREGGENLYLYEQDAAHPSGRTSFIATLVKATPGGSSGDTGQWREGPLGANLTPEGRYLVFTSHAGLTPDATRPEGPAQVYRYDASNERLSRISIGRQGFNDNGNAGAGNARIVELSGQSIVDPGRSDPTMSDDGSRIFFQSPNGLTPGALNDVAINGEGGLAQNTYEWEAGGTEVDARLACEEASGCVSLISDGRDLSAEGSHLLGTDAQGANVFFTSADQILPADTDSGYDVFDARENGGFTESPAATPCQGDTCRGSGTQAVGAPSPASGTFSGPEEGPGRSRASGCKKGFVKKGGKCVKKPRSKKQKNKGHKKTGHGKKAHKKNKRAAKSDRGAGK
jgi:Tol biopolymer transport system component